MRQQGKRCVFDQDERSKSSMGAMDVARCGQLDFGWTANIFGSSRDPSVTAASAAAGVASTAAGAVVGSLSVTVESVMVVVLVFCIGRGTPNLCSWKGDRK